MINVTTSYSATYQLSAKILFLHSNLLQIVKYNKIRTVTVT